MSSPASWRTRSGDRLVPVFIRQPVRQEKSYFTELDSRANLKLRRTPNMRVGILGTGDVGRALGIAFAQLGHQVKMGSREPKNEKATAWAVETGPAASTGTFAESAQFAEVAVLCTLWSGTEN